jgi:hypothetical protein
MTLSIIDLTVLISIIDLIMTLSIMTLSIMTLSIMTLSIMTLIIMTLSIIDLIVTLSIKDIQHNATQKKH